MTRWIEEENVGAVYRLQVNRRSLWLHISPPSLLHSLHKSDVVEISERTPNLLCAM